MTAPLWTKENVCCSDRSSPVHFSPDDSSILGERSVELSVHELCLLKFAYLVSHSFRWTYLLNELLSANMVCTFYI